MIYRNVIQMARSIQASGDLPFTLAGKSVYFLVIDRFARSGKQSHFSAEESAASHGGLDRPL